MSSEPSGMSEPGMSEPAPSCPHAAPPAKRPRPGKVIAMPRADATPRLLLVGNPNVGKSVLFKNLTHRYVNVSNFPGTTVEIVRARLAPGEQAAALARDVEVIDTPGLNDLVPRAEDAWVTRRVLDQHPDATVVQVADAKNLRRALLLTLQLAELGHPLVLVLNMGDELAARGGSIDRARLSALLGVPVVSTIAVRGEGMRELLAALPEARPVRIDGLDFAPDADDYERNRRRLERIQDILADTYAITPPARASLSARLGWWSMHPVKGLGILLAVLAAVFWFVGLFGAGTLVNLLEKGLFAQHLSPWAIAATDRLLPFPHVHDAQPVALQVSLPLTPVTGVVVARSAPTVLQPIYHTTAPLTGAQEVWRFLHDFLVGEYGLVTMALSYALAIVLPIVGTFFIVFSLLEDSGYLPRLSILLHKSFRMMGLNGKAVLPMVLGLGCDTMATMTTRILETKKERLVTTMLLALAVPCSAQLGVLLAMMATLSFGYALAWLALMTAILLGVGWLSARLFDGPGSDFVLELPPLRRPQLANVALKTGMRVSWYLREVIPLFIAGTGLLFVMDRLHLLQLVARWGEPLVTGWLGLPAQTSIAFLIGFLRRDYGAVYLLDAATGPHHALSTHQVFVAMVTITLFIPCFANFLMIAREHGWKTAWRMAGFIFPFAFLVGGLVHRLAP
jgi:ferrous iron transport protein B